MPNRQERRRQERAERKRSRSVFQDAADAGIRTVVVGDNIATASLGHEYAAADARGTMEPKVSGRHRWMAFGAWRIKVDDARHAYDENTPKLLDAENLITIGISCYDCERPLGPHMPGGVDADSTCEAGDSDV